jgi:D-glycero-D-manno-heptose 1,7-bisphosphate phosphatase
MMKDIGSRYGVDLRMVPMASDTLRDLQAAVAAGCEPHLVLSGRAAKLDAAQREHIVSQVPTTQVHADLGAFADHLLRRDHVPDSSPGSLS